MSNEINVRGEVGSTCLSLIDQAQTGCNDAWKQIVAIYARLLLYWCRQEGVAKSDLHEVTQEAFLSIHKSLGRYDKSKGSFRGWARRIAKRRAADYFRGQRKDVCTAAGGSTACQIVHNLQNPDPISVSKEKRLLYQQALELIQCEFQEKHQTAFKLMVLEGWKANEVAANLGMTENAVYMARHHILKRLKSAFAGALD